MHQRARQIQQLRQSAKSLCSAARLLAAAGVLLLLLAGCATRPTANLAPPEPPKPYLRVHHPDADTIALQVAVRKMTGPKRRSPTIWLVSAAHIGETNYYAELQRRLDACELVLFEGIGGAPPKRQPGEAFEPKSTMSLQTSLAESLGLVFQLEAIDYDRPHFTNSDVRVAQIQGMMAQTNSAGPGKEMQDLMQIMEGTSFTGLLMHTGVKLIAASPRLQATFKVVFIETLGQLRGDLSQSKALPPELQRLMTFIIQERNQIVLKDLETALATRRPPQAIGIFYGAGHMHDLEKRIAEQLNYRPAEDLWMTAFSVNTEEAGLTQTELDFVRGMVRWQMNQLQLGQDDKAEDRKTP